MTVTAVRTTIISFAGDLIGTESYRNTNTDSPAVIQLINLTSGATTVAIPISGTAKPRSVTIVPPALNTTELTLKGVSGDTGVILHLTDPTTVSLSTAPSSFVIAAGGNLTGLRLIWA